VAKKAAVTKAAATKAPVAKVKAASKSAPALLGTKELSDHIADTFEIPKSHAREYLDAIVAVMTTAFSKGQKVRISGLGVFEVRKRAARKGRNPQTGESLKIKPSKRVTFKTAVDLKEVL
jgi:DNA-binding protein HU-beta